VLLAAAKQHARAGAAAQHSLPPPAAAQGGGTPATAHPPAHTPDVAVGAAMIALQDTALAERSASPTEPQSNLMIEPRALEQHATESHDAWCGPDGGQLDTDEPSPGAALVMPGVGSPGGPAGFGSPFGFSPGAAAFGFAAVATAAAGATLQLADAAMEAADTQAPLVADPEISGGDGEPLLLLGEAVRLDAADDMAQTAAALSPSAAAAASSSALLPPAPLADDAPGLAAGMDFAPVCSVVSASAVSAGEELAAMCSEGDAPFSELSDTAPLMAEIDAAIGPAQDQKPPAPPPVSPGTTGLRALPSDGVAAGDAVAGEALPAAQAPPTAASPTVELQLPAATPVKLPSDTAAALSAAAIIQPEASSAAGPQPAASQMDVPQPARGGLSGSPPFSLAEVATHAAQLAATDPLLSPQDAPHITDAAGREAGAAAGAASAAASPTRSRPSLLQLPPRSPAAGPAPCLAADTPFPTRFKAVPEPPPPAAAAAAAAAAPPSSGGRQLRPRGAAASPREGARGSGRQRHTVRRLHILDDDDSPQPQCDVPFGAGACGGSPSAAAAASAGYGPVTCAVACMDAGLIQFGPEPGPEDAEAVPAQGLQLQRPAAHQPGGPCANEYQQEDDNEDEEEEEEESRRPRRRPSQPRPRGISPGGTGGGGASPAGASRQAALRMAREFGWTPRAAATASGPRPPRAPPVATPPCSPLVAGSSPYETAAELEPDVELLTGWALASSLLTSPPVFQPLPPPTAAAFLQAAAAAAASPTPPRPRAAPEPPTAAAEVPRAPAPETGGVMAASAQDAEPARGREGSSPLASPASLQHFEQHCLRQLLPRVVRPARRH
jgi:hypothetical protein